MHPKVTSIIVYQFGECILAVKQKQKGRSDLDDLKRNCGSCMVSICKKGKKEILYMLGLCNVFGPQRNKEGNM